MRTKLLPWILSALVVGVAVVAGKADADGPVAQGTPDQLRTRLDNVLGQALPAGSPEEATAIVELESLARGFEAGGMRAEADRAKALAKLLRIRKNERQV